MLTNILLCGAVNLCQLVLRQPQILICKAHRDTGNLVIVLNALFVTRS